jgi:hypothetical protein
MTIDGIRIGPFRQWWNRSYISYKEAYKHASAQLEAINQTDGKVWLKPAIGTNPPFVPLSARKTAIISLANLNGGVGKATLTANLGAAFASEGLRVLLIENFSPPALRRRPDRLPPTAHHRLDQRLGGVRLRLDPGPP